ncbi:MAG TPA: C4-dicarboxylate ABC transporter permease, partial [Pusillimonas sp.]|nr:C4-dicarboxylate ABC transporter permease [Pusillimonas sp.]
MDFQMWGGLIVLAVLVVLGVPVVFAFAASAALGLYFVFGSIDMVVSLLQQTALSGIKEYNFVVIPLFTAMGMLIAHCGAASDLFSVVNRLLKGVPGRLAVATVGGNAVFAAVTGVGVAAAAAFSHVAYPVMRDHNYSRSYAVGCIAGSSVLGLLIPPSVFMIVWAILTEQSVGTLFAAGVIPGLILALLYAVYCIAYAKAVPKAAPEQTDQGTITPVTTGQILGAIGVGILIVVTLGGIWFGYVTPTEGSAVGLVGAAILA